MSSWAVWLIVGAIMILSEIVLPGGVIIFIGLSACMVALLLYFGVVSSLVSALLTWFITSIIFLLFLRGFFMKYFEGDKSVDSVDENDKVIGSIVDVVESVYPHKEGRVKFRDSSWIARSEFEILEGNKAIIENIDGNTFIIKTV